MKVVWKPQAGSQTRAIKCPANHILYHGTRGPGKTDAQIMKFRRYVGQGYGEFWRGIIFDREYKNLDDVVAKSKKWFPKFDDGARWLSSKSDYKWVWKTGEELLFRHMKKEADYDAYHGHEYPFIGWNELNKYPTSACYDLMLSTNRTSFIPKEHTPRSRPLLPRIPLIVFSTTNPYGPGHNWVKRRFIDKSAPGGIYRQETNVYNPQTHKREDILVSQCHIFGSYKENRYLDPLYVATLENIKDPNRRAAWLFGDWDITSGGAFDDLWRRHVHVVPRFKIPQGWKVFRAFDWGSSHPFSCGWWAVANGEWVQMLDGSWWRPAPKSMIQLGELYGAEIFGGEKYGHNRGLNWSPRKVGDEIVEKEKALKAGGWIPGSIKPGPADSSVKVFNVDDEETLSVRKILSGRGAEFVYPDKKPGSRHNGFQMFRDMLEASRIEEGPGVYFMENCEASIETIPSLPRDEDDPDDVDTEAEDHPYDMTRYAITFARPEYTPSVDIGWTG